MSLLNGECSTRKGSCAQREHNRLAGIQQHNIFKRKRKWRRFWNNASHTNYANDYATSSIRKWLNEDFYNTAFTSAQKQNILPTTLDNKAYSADYSKYDSVSTTDNIFLLSHSEAKSIDEDTRWAEGTDYAKVQGFDDGFWHLRSAGNVSHESSFVLCGMLYNESFQWEISKPVLLGIPAMAYVPH